MGQEPRAPRAPADPSSLSGAKDLNGSSSVEARQPKPFVAG
ncbi:MAG: hypothetical protein AVDCRST_MAG64-134 [uncultured Phycisphaerae bacterium]|uniref:Uncharacterized protein n=1 Tax=uncultured Phycisphaerae bacterium TaxID=904963 RepID=A0A6J4N2X0_9BACT|nr:MAG: hypothetical protein AVDCRST_MAG64-134 [uncultured Phycisphaerae bacterium]